GGHHRSVHSGPRMEEETSVGSSGSLRRGGAAAGDRRAQSAPWIQRRRDWPIGRADRLNPVRLGLLHLVRVLVLVLHAIQGARAPGVRGGIVKEDELVQRQLWEDAETVGQSGSPART